MAALKALKTSEVTLTVNLGTGQGYSVLVVDRAFETASGRKVPYRIESYIFTHVTNEFFKVLLSFTFTFC